MRRVHGAVWLALLAWARVGPARVVGPARRAPATAGPGAVVTPTTVHLPGHTAGMVRVAAAPHVVLRDRLLFVANDTAEHAAVWDVSARRSFSRARLARAHRDGDGASDDACRALVLVTDRLVRRTGSTVAALELALAAARGAAALADRARLAVGLWPEAGGVVPGAATWNADAALARAADDSWQWAVEHGRTAHCVRMVFDDRAFDDNVVGVAYTGAACAAPPWAALVVSPNDGWSSLVMAMEVTLHEAIHAWGGAHQPRPPNVMTPVLGPFDLGNVLDVTRRQVADWYARHHDTRVCFAARRDAEVWWRHPAAQRATDSERSFAGRAGSAGVAGLAALFLVWV